MTAIGPGTRVTLSFSLSLASGELIDATGQAPASLEIGDGNLLPGFERAMFGLRAGDRETLQIQAVNGFGMPNADNVHILQKSAFSRDLELAEGLVVSFVDGDGGEIPGVIKRVFEDTVEVDFNHPLAGRDLLFSVEILSVEQVSNEIARG